MKSHKRYHLHTYLISMNLKTLSFCLLLITSFFDAHAQVEYLRLSPAQKISQRVGATDVTIEFSRPLMKDRKIFGGLVPYDKLWRTGANENTTIAFDHRVKIGDTEVSEGKYALITKPSIDHWEIYFYMDTDNMGLPNPIDSTKLIYLTKVDVQLLENIEEVLVINIYDITEISASLGISWEHTHVDIPISFYTQEAMEKRINQEFKQNIMDYSIASAYYSQRGIHLEKAKELIELVMELKESPNAWDYNAYGLILEQVGKKEEAIKSYKLSLQMAKETSNAYLISENERLLKEILK